VEPASGRINPIIVNFKFFFILQESPVARPKANTTKPKKVAAPIKKAAVKKFAAKKVTAQEIKAGEATAVESSAVEASAVESSAVGASAVESSAVEASAEEPAAEAKLADEAARPASLAAGTVKVNKSGKSKKSHAAASVAKVKKTQKRNFFVMLGPRTKVLFSKSAHPGTYFSLSCHSRRLIGPYC